MIGKIAKKQRVLMNENRIIGCKCECSFKLAMRQANKYVSMHGKTIA